MSGPRCFRCALEAVRPTKRINLQLRPQQQSRFYASTTEVPSPVTAGSKLASAPTRSASEREQIERLKDAPPKRAPIPATSSESVTIEPLSKEESNASQDSSSNPKPIPPNVAAAFRTPYRHPPSHRVKVASLQLRSFSVRNLEFFADFALRVAYYLKLSAVGPSPLPKKVERWTMPRSNFVHKKSQENFERITLKRMITIYDGHPDVVEVWLACLRKWQFYGVGMKANVWQHEGLDVVAKMDKQLQDVEKELDAKLANFGWNNDVAGQKSIEELLLRQGHNRAGNAGMEIRDEIKGAKNIDLFRDV